MRVMTSALVRPLRRAIIVRLAAVFVVLVPVTAGVLIATQASRLEDFISALAIHEAEAYAHDHPEVLREGLLAANPHNVSRTLTRFLAAGTGGRLGKFISGRVYGADGSVIAAAQIPDPRVPSILTDGPMVPDGLTVNALLGFAPAVLKVRFSAAENGGGAVLGYYEGVFLVSADAMADLRNTALLSAGAVAVVLALGATAIYPIIMALARRLLWRGQRLLHANTDTLEVLGSALAKRDAGTEEHGQRVTLYALRLGEAAGLGRDAMRRLAKGALLHDIGKIAIPDAVLLKAGPLGQDERRIMRDHVRHGLDIVGRSSWLAEAREVVGGHHEWFDGSGYPGGVVGTDIPETARVFAIVDVFDALTTRRPYKEPMAVGAAMTLLREGAGTHFDPTLIAIFEAIAPDLHAVVRKMRPETVQDELRGQLDRYLAPSDGGV